MGKGSDKKGVPRLRSSLSYGKPDQDGFIHRSWMRAQGLPDHVFDGRPIIGICNTWSELTPCNSSLREVAEYVKRGVWEAGGVPLEFPVTSLGETQMRPTAMLFRNLLAMDTEESIRGNPIDGVVLLGGCDKTTPGQLMGAASVDLPTIVVSSGPMLNGKFRGKDIGSGTDVWRFFQMVRAGEMDQASAFAAESAMSRSRGTCMTMGSASSFAAITEALGVSLPYNATLPAVDARRHVLSHESGRRIVELVRKDIRLSSFLSRPGFENAIKVHAAIGGSTNSVIHLLAIAGRAGVELNLKDFDSVASGIPLLANIQPSGEYLMEDLHYAGGIPAVMRELRNNLDTSQVTVSGVALKDIIQNAEVHNSDVIAGLESPFRQNSGVWVLSGNLAPNGAVMKPSAASDERLTHRGRAVVFESIEDFKARIDDPDLDVDENSVLVLKGCGPTGYPGMPEVGNMPLPRKLLQKGVRDMVRLSDARMSGTAFGTVVLHIAPESAVGGTLALVMSGDEILLDAPNRKLELLVETRELEARRAAWRPSPALADRGYAWLHTRHVLQADKGCDLDFLTGMSGSEVARESH